MNNYPFAFDEIFDIDLTGKFVVTGLSKKQAENPHLNIEYRWGMNAVNASDREIWSKK